MGQPGGGVWGIDTYMDLYMDTYIWLRPFTVHLELLQHC